MIFTAQLTPQLNNPQKANSGIGVDETQYPFNTRNVSAKSWIFGRSMSQSVESEQIYTMYDTTPHPNPTQVDARTLNESVIPLSILPPYQNSYPADNFSTVGTNMRRGLGIRVGNYSPPGTARGG